jgi:hypothetical protein
MKPNFEDQDGVYDDDGNGPYDRRYPGRRIVADKGVVRVPLMLMDAVPGRADTRSHAVKLRDESYALMLDRMKNPKNYDALTGRRLVNDGVVDDLSNDEIFQLAKRLSGPMCVAVPENWNGSSSEANEDRGETAGTSRDNRRPHYKPVRDRAEATKLRDESYALMVDRMRNPKRYDMNGRRA